MEAAGNFSFNHRFFAYTLGAMMPVLRFGQCVRRMSVAVFAVLAFVAVAGPARADEVQTASHVAAARRAVTSFGTAPAAAAAAATAPNRPGYASGFLFFPSTQPGMNIGGRVAVGKTHVYVPYYGVISNDPTHPGVQGAAGIAYGSRTWDISVLNGAATSQPGIPGGDASKVNPALSFSIRF